MMGADEEAVSAWVGVVAKFVCILLTIREETKNISQIFDLHLSLMHNLIHGFYKGWS